MKITVKKVEIFLIIALVIIMPFHTIIFNTLGESSILVLWRDLLLVILITIAVIKNKKLYVGKINALIAISWLVCGVHAVLFHDPDMPTSIWVNVFRVYLMPSLITLIITNIDVHQQLYKKIARLYVYCAFLISIFGIIQMFFIGNSYLEFIGVGQPSVKLADGFQRNIGVFESANVMGMFIVFAILILLIIPDVIKSKKFIFTLILSLLLTFSMSSYLAIGVAYIYKIVFINKKNLTKREIFNIYKIMGIAIIGLVGIYIVDKTFMSGVIVERISERVNEIIVAITAVDASSTSSATDHMRSLTEPISILKDNFLGLGFSTSTFMIQDKVSYPLSGLVESSIFTVLYDFGIVSGIIYYIPILHVISKKNVKPYNISYVNILSKMLCVSLMVSFVFLPLVQNYELRFFLFLFIGLAYNRNLQNSFIVNDKKI